MDVMNVETQGTMLFNTRCRNLRSSISRIIQDLNLQEIARISNVACRFDEPLHHVELVVNRKLNGDSRLHIENALRFRDLVLVLQVQVDQMVAMNAVSSQYYQDRQIRNEDENIEGGEFCRLRQPVPIVMQKLVKPRPRRRKDQTHCQIETFHVLLEYVFLLT